MSWYSVCVYAIAFFTNFIFGSRVTHSLFATYLYKRIDDGNIGNGVAKNEDFMERYESKITPCFNLHSYRFNSGNFHFESLCVEISVTAKQQQRNKRFIRWFSLLFFSISLFEMVYLLTYLCYFLILPNLSHMWFSRTVK